MNDLLPQAVAEPIRMIGGMVYLAVDTVRETLDHVFRGHIPFRPSLFFGQADRAGVGSVPLVALISFFMGLTMALLTGYQLRKFGTQNLVPGLVGIGFSRELGPLMTGIMVAARIGAAYTAELGTMTASEEVEAMEAMGIGPLRFLVAPRALAVFLLLPCLSVVSNLAALAGGALVCQKQFGISYLYFASLVMENLIARDIIAGVLKSFLFGLIIGLISCYKGLTVRGGASGVGTATTSSVVSAIAVVIAADTLFNIGMVMIYE
ncbi:MAG: ABC transporter permease [Verrucomicrobia bacterium]|nr:ABC transporter permease [Verrucomicrobiota bacterium]